MSKPHKEDQLTPIIEELTNLYAQAAADAQEFARRTNAYENIIEGYADRIPYHKKTDREEIISARCKSLDALMAKHFEEKKDQPLDVRAEDALLLHQQLEKLQNSRENYRSSIPSDGDKKLWSPSGHSLKSPYKEDMVMSIYALVKAEIAKPEFNKNPEFNMAMLAQDVATKITKYDELYENIGHARTRISDNGKMIAQEVGVFVRKCMKEEGKGFGKIQDFADFFIELKLKIKKAVGLAKENDHITTKLTAVGDLMKKKQETTPKHDAKPSTKKPDKTEGLGIS